MVLSVRFRTAKPRNTKFDVWGTSIMNNALIDLFVDHHPIAIAFLFVAVACLFTLIGYLALIWIEEIHFSRLHARRMCVQRRRRY
jgi:hypothetical protein